MSLQVDIVWLITALLASIRIAAALMFAPVLGPTKIPAFVKVLFAIALGSFCASTSSGSVGFNSVLELGAAAAREAAIGLSFGFGFMTAYAATQLAGRALDMQIGFGAAAILNPATQTLSPLIGSVFGMAMIAVFLGLDGHHFLLRAVTASFLSAPTDATSTFDFALVLQQSGTLFAFGLGLAAPVMFMLWLADVAMSVFARSMPQLNVFVLSFAIKILLGMVSLALSLHITRALLGGPLDSTFRYWDRLSVTN